MEPSLKSIENPNHGNVLSVLKAFRFFNHTCYVLSITLKWLCSICEKVISYIYTFVGNFMCTLIFSANFTATPFETFWFMKYALFWFLYQLGESLNCFWYIKYHFTLGWRRCCRFSMRKYHLDDNLEA